MRCGGELEWGDWGACGTEQGVDWILDVWGGTSVFGCIEIVLERGRVEEGWLRVDGKPG